MAAANGCVFLCSFYACILTLAFQVLDRVLAFLPRGDEIVLIHCVEGRSRSAAVVIGLLMKREKKTFADAFALVKKARPRIAIQNFVTQLEKL